MIITTGGELIMIYQRILLLRIIKFDRIITNNQLWWTVYGLSICDKLIINYN